MYTDIHTYTHSHTIYIVYIFKVCNMTLLYMLHKLYMMHYTLYILNGCYSQDNISAPNSYVLCV